MIKSGLCMNVGNCNNASQHKVLEIGVGEDFVCPECHKSLLVYTPRKTPPTAVLAVGGVLFAAAVAGAGWLVYSRLQAEPAPMAVQNPPLDTVSTPPPSSPPSPAKAPVAAGTSGGSDRLPPCGSNDDTRRRLKLCD